LGAKAELKRALVNMDGGSHIPDAKWLIQMALHPVFCISAMLFGARDVVV
jgi:hypothetical protein